MASKNKYHITYQKVNTSTMEDDEYTDATEWHTKVCNDYKNIGGRTISSQHSNLLKNALTKRIKNKSKNNNKIGYRIFDKIIGEYLINIEDRKVIDDRLQILGEFLDIINKDKSLSTIDPQPEKLGDNVGMRSGVKELDAMKEAILVMAYKQNKAAAFGGVMGYITNHFSDLDPKAIAKKLGKILPEENSMLQGKARATLLKMIKLEFPDAAIEDESVKGSVKDTIKEQEITYYFGAGVYEPTEIFYELSNGKEKNIKIKDIIKKIGHDKKAQKRLNQIKPGSSLWPMSATGNYYLVISNDPVLVATKSTGRYWASSSCENYGGAYHQGPYSDIEHGNCIVYIFKDDKTSDGWPMKFGKTLKGRTLLRWGNRDDEAGVYDVGVEKRVYPSNKVWGLQIATAIGLILKDAGFLKYKNRCRTPYLYKGWADSMGKNNCRINYTKLIMEGQTVDLDQAVFGPEMELASSPMISYSDCNRLSRQNVDIRIRRELAQNPIIWNQEMALGRLIRSKDSLVCNLLSASPLAHPAALASMAEHVADIDPENYRNPLQTNSLIFNIASNPNSNIDVYDSIVKNHPGFIDNNGNEVGSAEEILYLGLLDRNNNYSWDNDNFISLAPSERIDQLIDGFVSYKASSGMNNRGKSRVIFAKENNIIDYGLGVKPAVADVKNCELGIMVRNLMLSPNLNEAQYYKLLNLAKKIKFKDISSNNNHYVLMDSLIKAFLLNLKETDSWGFNAMFKITKSESCKTNFNLISEELKDNYMKYNRQSPHAFEIIHNIAIGDGGLQIERASPWHKMFIQLDFLISNGMITDSDTFDYLWRRRAKLDISTFSFCNKSRNNVNELEPGLLLIDGRRLNIAFEELSPEELLLFRWDFMPTGDRGERKIRNEVSSELVNNILKKGSSEIRKIGFDTVSNWLRYPRQFNMFIEVVLSTAVGDYYSVKDKSLQLPYSEDEMFMNPSFIELHENNLQYIKILNDAANGIYGEGGLCRNPHIPENIQIILIKTWKDISETYDGFYHEDYYNIIEAISRNKNTSSHIIDDLYTKHRKLHQDIALNPNTSQKILLTLYKEYPSEVLSNVSMTAPNYTRLWYLTMEVLRTEVEVDIDRLVNLFRNNIGNLQSSISGVKRRQLYAEILRENSNWLNYWRGGRVKSGGFSEFVNQNMWEDGGLADVPIPIRGKKFVMINSANKKKNQANSEIYFVNNMEGKGKDNLKIDGSVIKYNQETGVWDETKLDGRKTYTAIDFFNFIPPDKRGGKVKVYHWDFSKFKTNDKNEMKQHIDRYNESNEEDHDYDEIMDTLQDADKWNIDNIFVFTDGKPPKGQRKVPVWRYTWDKTNMYQIIKSFIIRKDYKDIKVLMKDWNQGYKVQGANIDGDRQAALSLSAIYEVIDNERLWTKELIDDALPDLLYNKGEIFMKLNHIPLTKKLLTSTLCETDEELVEQGLGGLVTLHDLNNIKKKILNYPVVPIPYIYHILESTIQPDLVNMAKNIRNQRPREYNQFLLEMTPDHPEGPDIQ